MSESIADITPIFKLVIDFSEIVKRSLDIHEIFPAGEFLERISPVQAILPVGTEYLEDFQSMGKIRNISVYAQVNERMERSAEVLMYLDFQENNLTKFVIECLKDPKNGWTAG